MEEKFTSREFIDLFALPSQTLLQLVYVEKICGKLNVCAELDMRVRRRRRKVLVHQQKIRFEAINLNFLDARCASGNWLNGTCQAGGRDYDSDL